MVSNDVLEALRPVARSAGGHKGVLKGCVPEVLAFKCLLHFLYSITGRSCIRAARRLPQTMGAPAQGESRFLDYDREA